MAINTNNSEIGGKITQALSAGSGVDIHDLAKTLEAVSYTHLTLPTTPYV